MIFNTLISVFGEQTPSENSFFDFNLKTVELNKITHSIFGQSSTISLSNPILEPQNYQIGEIFGFNLSIGEIDCQDYECEGFVGETINYNVVGTPTIQNKRLYDTTETDYISNKESISIDPNVNDFEINFVYHTPQSITNCELLSTNIFSINVNNSRISCIIDGVETHGSYLLSPNISFYIKVVCQNKKMSTWISFDGNLYHKNTFNLSFDTIITEISFGKSSFNGYIDLNYISINKYDFNSERLDIDNTLDQTLEIENEYYNSYWNPYVKNWNNKEFNKPLKIRVAPGTFYSFLNNVYYIFPEKEYIFTSFENDGCLINYTDDGTEHTFKVYLLLGDTSNKIEVILVDGAMTQELLPEGYTYWYYLKDITVPEHILFDITGKVYEEFIQPVLNEYGTLGGNSFACQVPTGTYGSSKGYYITRSFPSTQALGEDDRFQINSVSTSTYYDIIFYNPEEIKITSLNVQNDDGKFYASAYRFYGSNDGTSWVLLSEGTNNISTTLGIWDTILVSTSEYYKYFKFSVKPNNSTSIMISRFRMNGVLKSFFYKYKDLSFDSKLTDYSSEPIAISNNNFTSSVKEIELLEEEQKFLDYSLDITGEVHTNYTIIGSPTISEDYIASGFSNSSYLQGKESFPTISSSFDWITRAKMDNFNEHNMLFTCVSAQKSYNVRRTTKAFSLYNGSWVDGTTVLSANTWYWFRVIYDGSSWKGYVLEDQGYTLETLPSLDAWNLEWTSSSSWSSNVLFNIGTNTYYSGQYMHGSIDLMNTKYIADGVEWRAVVKEPTIKGCCVNYTDTGDADTLNAYACKMDDDSTKMLLSKNDFTLPEVVDKELIGTVNIPNHILYQYELVSSSFELKNPFDNLNTHNDFVNSTTLVDNSKFIVNGDYIEVGPSYKYNNVNVQSYMTITSESEINISVTCYTSSEGGYDLGFVYVGTNLYNPSRDQIRNRTTDGHGSYMYVGSGQSSDSTYTLTVNPGTYYFIIGYTKDGSGVGGSDTLRISNIKINSEEYKWIPINQ